MAILLKPRADRLLKPQPSEVQPEFTDNPGFWRDCVAFAMPNGETTQDDIPNLAKTKYTFQSYSSTIAQPEAEDIGPAIGYSIDGTRVAEALQVAETDFIDTYLTGAGAFTVGVYIKYPALNTSGVDAYAGAWSARTGSTGRQKKTLLCDINGTAYFYCRNAANTAEVFATGTATKTPFKRWSMAVGVFDAGAMRIYINGVLAGSNTLGSTTINSTSESEPFELVGGHFTTVTQSWSPRFHHGYSFFHSRALTGDEIAELYADPFGPVRESRQVYFVPAGGGTSPATGTAAGTSTASGVGASTAATAGSSAGTGAATGVGASTSATDGSASGTGAASGVGASTVATTGSAAGTGAASGVGASTAAATGTAAGVATAPGVGQGLSGAAVGTAAGTSTATGVGASTVAATGTAAGSSTALGVSFVPAAEVEAVQGGWGHRRGDEWDVRSEDDRRRTTDEARREAVRRAFDALDPEVRPGPVPKKIERRIAAKAKEIAPEVDLSRAKATLAALRVQIDAVWQERQAELARMRDDEEALIALLMVA